MKKILLGLFLMLGAISFATPSHINVAKIKQDGHSILMDENNSYSFGELVNQNSLLVVTYYVGELGEGGPIATAIMDSCHAPFLYTTTLKYVLYPLIQKYFSNKLYAQNQGFYFYIVIAKKQKVKNYVVTGIFQTTEEYSSKSDLKEIIKEKEIRLFMTELTAENFIIINELIKLLFDLVDIFSHTDITILEDLQKLESLDIEVIKNHEIDIDVITKKRLTKSYKKEVYDLLKNKTKGFFHIR